MLEALEHDGAALLSLLDDLSAHLGQRAAGHRGTVGELIDEMQRNVELAHGAERLCQAPDLALRLPRFGVLQSLGQHRKGLAQPP